jgi:hypothetical protein
MVLQVDKLRVKCPVVIREFFARLNIAFRHSDHLFFALYM